MASAYPEPSRRETFPALTPHVEPLILPLEIDDALLTAPVLYGELFPLVSNPPAASASREEFESLLFGPNPAFTNALDFDTDDVRAAVLESFATQLEQAQSSEPEGKP